MPSFKGEKWGPGRAGKREYLTADGPNKFQDGTPFTLFFGEHPHTRSDNNIYADLGPGRDPVGFDGHRVRTKIVIEEANYLKSGIAGEKIRGQCWADIFLNDTLVFRLTNRRHAADMLLLAHATLATLLEHPVQLWRADFDGLVGRKIYYRDQPAAVTKYIPDQGAMLITHAGPSGAFPPPAYRPDDLAESILKVDFLDPHVWWFRKESTRSDARDR